MLPDKLVQYNENLLFYIIICMLREENQSKRVSTLAVTSIACRVNSFNRASVKAA